MTTLMCTRTSCLRAFSNAPRSFSAASRLTAAFTTSAQPLKQQRLQTTNSRPTISAQLPTHRFAPVSRKESTSAPTSHAIPDDLLTWDKFFDLRRKRRWVNLGCSVFTGFAAVGVAMPIIAQQDFDNWGAQISGLDPIIVLGISTFAIAAGGWLCGPSFGNLMFSLWAGRRGWKRGIAEKEKSFYARIKRYRADASASSPQNPIPDYYGEKIGSVKDYRRWLKDQKAFNLKKDKNML